MVDWQIVRERFRYFRDAVNACGETRVLFFNDTLGRHIRFLESLTDDQLLHLTRLYKEILARGDLESLWGWLPSAAQGSESEKTASWRIGGILIVLADLAESGIEPFCRQPR